MCMRPAMYLFANRDLGMSPGKLAAQVAHAAVEAYRLSDSLDRGIGDHQRKHALRDAWYNGGHYTKLVMLAEDTEQLHHIKHYIEERGYQTKLIVDEGRTEIESFSATALGVEVVDRDDEHTAATFGEFQTYKPLKSPKKKRFLRR
jgi:PTH2 family peptidyl-tRNA hydrolase